MVRLGPIYGPCTSHQRNSSHRVLESEPASLPFDRAPRWLDRLRSIDRRRAWHPLLPKQRNTVSDMADGALLPLLNYHPTCDGRWRTGRASPWVSPSVGISWLWFCTVADNSRTNVLGYGQCAVVHTLIVTRQEWVHFLSSKIIQGLRVFLGIA